MSTFRIIREAFTILFGIGAIVAGVVLEAEDPWLYIIGVGLVCWGAWDIFKEVRDSGNSSDVAAMAKKRDEISKKLGTKD